MKLATDELVGFVKERHYRQVRVMTNKPVLAIVMVGEDGPSRSFVLAKQRYGEDIGVEVHVKYATTEAELTELLTALSQDESVDGIVLQLPLPASFNEDAMIKLIPLVKDVDGLVAGSPFDAPTAKGIMWLLGAQHLKIKESNVAVVGQGRLVGKPVADMLEASGAKVVRLDENSEVQNSTKSADIIISATGQPGIIKRDMLPDGAIVIDAGTSEAGGSLVGDVDTALYDDPAIKVTPVPGGIGPMTVAALFDNLLIAAS